MRHNQYHLYDVESKRLTIGRDVVFDESFVMSQQNNFLLDEQKSGALVSIGQLRSNMLAEPNMSVTIVSEFQNPQNPINIASEAQTLTANLKTPNGPNP
jgi:hypothetical protein